MREGWPVMHGRGNWGRCCFGMMELGLIGYVLSFPLGETFREVASIMAVLGVVGYYVSDYRNSNLSKFFLKPLFFVFFGILIFKTFDSISVPVSLKALSAVSYGSLLLFFPALEMVRDKKSFDLVTMAFLLLLFYLGLDALYQYHYGHDFFLSIPKGPFLSATRKDPLLGNLVAVFLPISFSFYYLLPKILNKAERLGLYILLTFPPYFFLCLSGRRTGWIAFAVVTAIYCWVRFGKLASVPIVLGALALPFSGAPRMALNSITGDIRWKIWAAAYEVFQKHWLLGTGLDTFKQAQIKYNDVVIMAGKHVECTHNIYWGFLVDTGAVGLLIFLASSIGCALYAFDTYRKIRPVNPPLSHQIFCFVLSWLAFLVVGLAGIDFYATWAVGSPVVVLGALMGACIMSRDVIKRDCKNPLAKILEPSQGQPMR